MKSPQYLLPTVEKLQGLIDEGGMTFGQALWQLVDSGEIGELEADELRRWNRDLTYEAARERVFPQQSLDVHPH